jgi:allophanate hydrolase subunit 2
VIPGPRDRWLVHNALATLCDPRGYEVSTQSNRVGARLIGPLLSHLESRELPPEPMVTGALQVPPSGQPILFLADHPVTGGYPVIAVVHDDDLPLAAQARPGQRLRFVLYRHLRSRGPRHQPLEISAETSAEVAKQPARRKRFNETAERQP